MKEVTQAPQPWLIPYENPLEARLGKDFFKSIPKRAGVYIMYGAGQTVLYVGKAKDLRSRLNSYKRARPDQVSRKVIRMVHLIREIRYEECGTEKDALLRENHLLREMQPPFNVVNTSPESYYFIGIRQIGKQVRFRLTVNPKRQGDILYGSYKGRGRVRDSYSSLLRLIWITQNLGERFELPTKLTRRKPAYLYTQDFPTEWFPLLKKFLNGSDPALLSEITLKLLEKEQIPRFVYSMIQDDLETVQRFFEWCPKRNRHLRLTHQCKGRVIPQNRLDDLLVLEMARVGKIDRLGNP